MRKYPLKLQVYRSCSLKSVIKAVEDLLDYYKNPRARRYDTGNCPLCFVFECDSCLWQVFHRMDCEAYVDKMYPDIQNIDEVKKMKKWRAFRVKDLTCWLQELKRPGVKLIFK